MNYLFSFLTALLIFANTAFSQPQVDKAAELLKANRIIEAKTTIDQFLKAPANQKNAKAWYTKSKVYVAIAADASMLKQYPSSRMEAFKAMKAYTETDDKMLIALQIDGYRPINEIYTGYYQSAANSFNTKDYVNAYENFVHAISVSSFMTKKGWINLALDTNAVLYAAVSAEKLNRPDQATKYYSQLIDARVKGEGFVEIYKWVANYYFENKNIAAANKYLGIGRESFPADLFWNSLELDISREGGNKDVLFAQYEKTIAADPSNHLYRYNYAVELYQVGYNVDPSKRPANSEQLLQKAATQISKVLQLRADYVRGQLLAGQMAYNAGVDFLTRSKSASVTTDASNLKAKAIAKFDEATPYLLAVGHLLEPKTNLSTDDKADLKEAYDLLITISDQKGDKEKVSQFEAKFKAVDKL